jgi:hypothetical protein
MGDDPYPVIPEAISHYFNGVLKMRDASRLRNSARFNDG